MKQLQASWRDLSLVSFYLAEVVCEMPSNTFRGPTQHFHEMAHLQVVLKESYVLLDARLSVQREGKTAR